MVIVKLCLASPAVLARPSKMGMKYVAAYLMAVPRSWILLFFQLQIGYKPIN